MLGHFSADFAEAGLSYSVEEYALLCSGADCRRLVFSVLIPAVLDGSTPTEKCLKLMKRYDVTVTGFIQARLCKIQGLFKTLLQFSRIKSLWKTLVFISVKILL